MREERGSEGRGGHKASLIGGRRLQQIDVSKDHPFTASGGAASLLIFENSIHSDVALSREKLGESEEGVWCAHFQAASSSVSPGGAQQLAPRCFLPG